MSSTLAVCFVWHFHQPQYQDLSTPKAVLPWARLHCTRNYTMMLHVLEAQPAAHVTINLTPVLAAQLDAFANETCTDEWLQLSVARVTELDMDQRSRLVAMFFDVNQERVVGPDSRYHQLSLHRSDAIKTWSEQELRDLQCLFMRAWTDSGALTERPEGTRLLGKVRDFTDDDTDNPKSKRYSIIAKDLMERIANLRAEIDPITFDSALLAKHVFNPDGPDVTWAYPVGNPADHTFILPMVIAEKPAGAKTWVMLRDMKMVAVPLTRKDKEPLKKTPRTTQTCLNMPMT